MAKITDDFLAVIGELFELYGQQASTIKVNIYWSTLGQYAIDLFRRTVKTWVRKSQFMSNPSDLINLMDGLSNHLSLNEA